LTAISLSDEQTLLLRLRAQRLWVPDSASVTVAQVVKGVCGLQAQEAPAAVLAMRVRSTGLMASDFDSAQHHQRSIVRTWCMRGTLHVVTAEDFTWLVPLLGPHFILQTRHRYRQLGLDEDTCERGVRTIRDALAAQGPLTREDVARHLTAHGIPAEGQATIHLIRRAALEGIVCIGPDQGAKPTYVLVQDWLGQGRAPAPDAARAELARRYLAAYGPAGPGDLAAWSGLGIGQARQAWELITSQLIQVEVRDGTAWMLKTQADRLHEPLVHPPIVQLLPKFDTYLLGYSSRDLVVEPQHAKRIHPGGGLLYPTLLVNGRAGGVWSAKRRGKRLEVVVEPFAGLTAEIRHGLEAEIADLSRFLATETALSVEAPP
jgi:hypothetical protein